MKKTKKSLMLFSILTPLFLGATTFGLISSTKQIDNSNQVISTSNQKQVTSIPNETTDATLVDTGVAVVKNGDNSIIPQLYLEKLVQNNNEDELKTYLSLYFYEVAQNPLTNAYLPITANVPTFTIVDKQANNHDGTITVTIEVSKYVENAVEFNQPKKIVATISGFRSVDVTSVSLNNSFNFANYTKGDLLQNDYLLKQAITVNYLPVGADYRVEPIEDTTWQNPTSFDVNVIVSAYYDNNYQLVKSEKTFKLTISGLKSGLTTSVKLKSVIDKSIYPSLVTKQDIENYLIVENLPEGSQIIINYNPSEVDNKLGQITFSVSFSKIYSGSQVVDGTNKIFDFQVTGYKTVNEFSKLKEKPNFKNYKASDINVDNVDDYFDISTFPEGVTFSGGNFTPVDVSGTLVIENLVASYGFSDDNKFSLQQNYIVPRFEVTGLITQAPTGIVVNNFNHLGNDFFAESFKAEEIIKNFITLTNLPPRAVVEIRNIQPNNLLGELTFELYISKIYDANGLIQLDFSKQYTITGFKIVSESKIVQKQGLDLSNVYVVDLNRQNINTYVDFISFPDDVTFSKFQFNNKSNITGTVDFSFVANKWYDENGFLKPSVNDEIKTKEFSLQLTGFAQHQPTQLVKKNIDNSGRLAQDIDTQAEASTLFDVVNPSNEVGFETGLIISNFKYNNLLGTLSFVVTINNYYDENGILRKTSDSDYAPLTIDFQFDNFKKINVSTVSQIKEPSSILPTDMTDTKIRDYIDLTSFPNDANYKFTILNPINKSGTFDLVVEASKWYDDNGKLITEPKDFLISIVGGKKQNPTKIVKKQFDVSNILASDIDTIDEIVKLVDIINPYGTYTPGTSWTFTNLISINSEGTLSVDIIVYEYYDANGNPVTNASNNYLQLKQTLTFSGFKKTTKSVLLQNNVNPSQILPSQVKSNNTWKNYVDFSTFPTRMQIIDSKTTAYDNLGKLVVNASIKYYHNELGKEISEANDFMIELTGFKTQSLITQILPIDNIEENVTTYDANELYNTNKQEFINKYINVVNPPNTHTITLSPLNLDNVGGSITLTVTLSDYYDEYGNTNKNLEKNITINGFKKIKKSSITRNKGYDFSTYTAQQFSNEFLSLSPTDQITKFKEITTFDSVPADATFSLFSLQPINIEGIVTLSTVASKLYDNSGNIVNNQTVVVNLEGFMRVEPSQLLPLDFSKNFPASDLVINANNFWTYFNPSLFPTDTNVSGIKINYSNIDGKMNVTATFDKYYGIDGNVVKNPIILSSEITGFKKVNESSELRLKNNISNDFFTNTPSNVITNNQLDYLFNAFIDTSLFPQENSILGIAPTNFVLSSPIANDRDGTIKFSVIVDKFYSGSLNNLLIESRAFDILVGGFKKTQPSSIEILNNKKPSEIGYDDLKFVNFEITPSENDVQFVVRDDETGRIEIIILNASFYDENGTLKTNQQFSYRTSIAVKNENKDLPLILGLSITFGTIGLASVSGLGWWIWYRRTHEI